MKFRNFKINSEFFRVNDTLFYDYQLYIYYIKRNTKNDIQNKKITYNDGTLSFFYIKFLCHFNSIFYKRLCVGL